MSRVEYEGRVLEDGFTFFYNTIDSHKNHAPTKATLKGRIWEKKLYEIYKYILTKDDVAIDVGGYIGSHALPLSHYCKSVFVFEPHEELFNCLTSNIELNNVENIEAFNLALSNNHNTKTMSFRDDGISRIYHESYSKEKMLNFHHHHHVDDVECIALDSLCGDMPNIKLLKIDVEGHEFKVLEGAKQTIENNRPHILIEVFKTRKNDLEEWAEKNKYNIEFLRGEDYYLTPLP